MFQLRKSFLEKTKRALEETRWLAAQVLRAALQVDDFISSPGRLGSVRWGRVLPCLCLVLSCSLSDSSFPLYSVDVNLTYNHLTVFLRRRKGLWNPPWRSQPALLWQLVLPLPMKWERSRYLVHILPKLTKGSPRVPGVGPWSSPEGPPQGLPGSLILGLLDGPSEIQKDQFCT